MILNSIEMKKIASLRNIVLKNSEFSCEIENISNLGLAFFGGTVKWCDNPVNDRMVGAQIFISNHDSGNELEFTYMERSSIINASLSKFGRDGIFLTTGEKLIECVPHIKEIVLGDDDEQVKVNINTMIDDVELKIQSTEDQLIVFSSKEKEPVFVIDIDKEESEAKLTVLEPLFSNVVRVKLKNCIVVVELKENSIHTLVAENINNNMEIIDEVELYHKEFLKSA